MSSVRFQGMVKTLFKMDLKDEDLFFELRVDILY